MRLFVSTRESLVASQGESMRLFVSRRDYRSDSPLLPLFPDFEGESMRLFVSRRDYRSDSPLLPIPHSPPETTPIELKFP